MQTKLTLRMDDRLIERAKAWARERGVSLSEAVASLFDQLSSAPNETLSPWTRKLVGMAGRARRRPLTDDAVRGAHLDRLAEKHR